MAYPQSWPPRQEHARKSLRFFKSLTTTGRFDDSAYIWFDEPGANPYLPTPVVPPGGESTQADYLPGMGGGTSSNGVLPQIPAQMIRIINDGAVDIEFSFDGVYVHGFVKAGETLVYRFRVEAGIALRSVGVFATGSITTVAVASLVDGETVTIGDGVTSEVFEFDVAGDGVAGGNISVDVSTLVTANDVRDALITAINGTGLEITASNGGAALVNLVADNYGTGPNVAITETVVNAGFVVSGMAGGAAAGSAVRLEAW